MDKVLSAYLVDPPTGKAATPYLSENGVNKDGIPELVLLSALGQCR